MIRRRQHERGLTLVEVLATMVVVAVVLPVAMRGITLCTSLAGITQERGEATMLAESKLNELQATGDWQYGALAGDFGEDWPDYRWEAYVEEFGELNLDQLHVVVTWTSRGQEREVVLTTLVSADLGITQ